MKLRIIVCFVSCALGICFTFGSASAQKRPAPRKPNAVPSTETVLRKEARNLSSKQKALVLKVLGILDKSDVLFFTGKDADKFQLNIRNVVPLLDRLESELPKGKFYDLLNSTILAYMDFGVLIQIVGIRHEKGADAFDEKVTDSLAEIAKRYESILGTGSNVDMLDPDVGAEILIFAVNLKKRIYALIR
jgi:hypothetical protein